MDERHVRLSSLGKVFLKCFTKTEIDRVTDVLKSVDAITEDQFQTAYGNKLQGIGFILHQLGINLKYQELLLKAYEHEDFPGDHTLKYLVRWITRNEICKHEILFQHWEDLEPYKYHFLCESGSVPSDNIRRLIKSGKYPWQVYLIHAIVKREDENEAEILFTLARDGINEMQSYKKEKGIDEQTELLWQWVEVRVKIKSIKRDGQLWIFLTDENQQKQFEYCNRKQCYVVRICVPVSRNQKMYELHWKNVEKKSRYIHMYYGSKKACRLYELTQEQNTSDLVVLYDLVNFEQDFPDYETWIDHAVHEMCNFLPTDLPSPQHELMIELNFWKKQLEDGWKVKCGNSTEHLKLDQHELSKVLTEGMLKWLKSMNASLTTANSERIKHQIIIIINLLLILQSKWTIGKDNGVSLIFNLLSIHKLSQNEQSCIYDYFMKNSSIPPSGIPDPASALMRIFKRAVKTSGKWILVLPLYWLFMKRCQWPIPFTDHYDQEHSKELPQIEGVQWNKSEWKLSTDEAKDLLPQIYKTSAVHPWIYNPYLFLVTGETLLKLIECHPEECLGFNVALVIEILLQSKLDKNVKLKEVMKSETYLKNSLDQLQTSIRSGHVDKARTAVKVCEVISNFLMRIVESSKLKPKSLIFCCNLLHDSAREILKNHSTTLLQDFLPSIRNHISKISEILRGNLENIKADSKSEVKVILT